MMRGDCDLLLGRDIATSAVVTTADLAAWLARWGVTAGLLGSLRAGSFDVASGNAEVAAAAAELGLTPTLTLDTRDYLTARRLLREAPDRTVLRLMPQRQDTPATSPAWARIARLAAERGLVVACEGDPRVYGPVFCGLDASVIFLDAHFYHLGDLVALGEDEPGFCVSTRALNGPDSIRLMCAELGPERVLFGSRAGFHEGASALAVLAAAGLDAAAYAAVAGGNLQRILGRQP